MKDRDSLPRLESHFVAYANIELDDTVLYDACVVTNNNGTNTMNHAKSYLGYDLRYLATRLDPNQHIYVKVPEPMDKNLQL